ncbi:Ca2+ regulator and membrane fusion protein Fig1-domain-containing protein [Aspergillus avenaceus]|uniref:Ca2+ regulator and membrane fusion protein Fig1-domain-containing protein n=1 Tax=Aspergillus avenaceus TaxID=36643 RepID=A0A5N6TU66_ASPAV|nr:Ca2+ regulator and membrane fusion protein Fig1-domain-containing protein [Aspergillus avenaceus]
MNISKKPFFKISSHHILMVICLISIIILSVLVSGCSSTEMSNIYLISMEYNNITNPVRGEPVVINHAIAEHIYNISENRHETIRGVLTGYRGFCVIQRDGAHVCSTRAATLAKTINGRNSRLRNTTVDPLNLIWMSQNFQDKMAFDGFVFMSIILMVICIVLFAGFPGWRKEIDSSGEEKEVKPYPSRWLMYSALVCSGLSSTMGLVVMQSQYNSVVAAGVMAEQLMYGAIQTHVGAAGMALGWVAVMCMGVVAIAAFGYVVKHQALSLIRKMLDKKDEEQDKEEP